MAEQYGSTNIPGTNATVRSGGTVSVGVAFNTTCGLVGGMDVSNGSATPGSVVTVESSADAASKFGENSELKNQVDLALSQQSPPSTIYAVGVSETTVTSEGVSQSDSVSNAPVFDPNVNGEHAVSLADTGGTDPDVNIVYESPPSTPTDSDTANFNPVTGELEVDAAASGSYEIDYDYGDYSTAITEVAKKVPRAIGVCTENTSVKNTLVSELNSYDVDFDFSHGYAGVMPGTSASSYTDSFDDRRLAVVAASRGYTDDAETNEVRTVGAVAGKQAGKPLGDSTSYESLGGLASLRTSYTNSEIANLIDEQVYPIRQSGGIQVLKDQNTSTETKFERIYASEIIDEATEISNSISQSFVGSKNTEEQRLNLRESHTSSYAEMSNDNLLENYHVSVSKGSNDFEVVVDIGIDVIGVMDTISITVTAGDVVVNGGVA